MQTHTRTHAHARTHTHTHTYTHTPLIRTQTYIHAHKYVHKEKGDTVNPEYFVCMKTLFSYLSYVRASIRNKMHVKGAMQVRVSAVVSDCTKNSCVRKVGEPWIQKLSAYEIFWACTVPHTDFSCFVYHNSRLCMHLSFSDWLRSLSPRQEKNRHQTMETAPSCRDYDLGQIRRGKSSIKSMLRVENKRKKPG